VDADTHEVDVGLVRGLDSNRLDVRSKRKTVIPVSKRQIVTNLGNGNGAALTTNVGKWIADQAGGNDVRRRRGKVHRRVEDLCRDAAVELIGQVRRDKPSLANNPGPGMIDVADLRNRVARKLRQSVDAIVVIEAIHLQAPEQFVFGIDVEIE